MTSGSQYFSVTRMAMVVLVTSGIPLCHLDGTGYPSDQCYLPVSPRWHRSLTPSPLPAIIGCHSPCLLLICPWEIHLLTITILWFMQILITDCPVGKLKATHHIWQSWNPTKAYSLSWSCSFPQCLLLYWVMVMFMQQMTKGRTIYWLTTQINITSSSYNIAIPPEHWLNQLSYCFTQRCGVLQALCRNVTPTLQYILRCNNSSCTWWNLHVSPLWDRGAEHACLVL